MKEYRTELWTGLLVIVAATVLRAAKIVSDEVWLGAVVTVQTGYVASRTIIKKTIAGKVKK